jgi:hypothetical protein
MLMGKQDWLSSLKSMLTSLAETVEQTFIDGLMEPLTGPNSVLMQKLKSLGSKIFGQGLGMGDMASGQDSGVLMLSASTTMSSAANQFSMAVQSFSVSKGYDASGIVGAVSGSGGFDATAFSAPTDIGADSLDPNTFQKVSEDLSSTSDRTNTSLFQVSDLKMVSGFAMVGGLLTTMLSSGASSGKVNWLGIALGAVSTVAGAVGSYYSSAKAKGGLVTKLATGGLFGGEGGLLHGAGHGTSDSINAMLSNGEFVVNAQATSKHLGLLTAINSGQISKYASGGLVSNVSAAPSYVDLSKSAKSSSTDKVGNAHFTINITGDVSRQTRSEIQKMIPNIASGVNSFNREKGNR